MKLQVLLVCWVHLYLVLFSVDRAFSHYVVFEEVGQLATSVAYLHVTIPLNISELHDKIQEYFGMLDKTTPFIRYQHDWEKDMWKQIYFDERFVPIMKRFTSEFTNMTREMRSQADRLLARFEHIKSIMPFVASSSSLQNPHGRTKRFIPLLLLKGVFGTIHGLYSRNQYKQLKKELQGVIREQQRLLEMIREQAKTDADLSAFQDQLVRAFEDFSLMTPLRTVVTLRQLEREIDQDLSRLYDTVQQAQNRRLSVTLLSAVQLKRLYDGIQTRANELQSDVMLEQPSDLFQTELSYAYDGSDITLVMHVPTVTRGTALRLMKFHPFPLSFSATHFLLPRPTHTLFAISSTEPRMHLELDESDLEGCYRIGSTHLCERMGILSNVMDNSCLGAMYEQRFKQAMSACTMDVMPLTETVLQLSDSWFIIYATQSFTGYVTCRNGSSTEHHLKLGVNRIPVSPTCSLRLKQHTLFSDTTLRLSGMFKQYQWNLEDITFSESEVSDAAEVLEQVAAEGENRPTLADVRAHSAQNKRNPKWLYFFILVGVTALLCLLTWIGCMTYTKHWFYLRDSLKIIHNKLFPPKADSALYETIPLQPRHFLPPHLKRSHRRSQSDGAIAGPSILRSHDKPASVQTESTSVSAADLHASDSRRSHSQPADLPTPFTRRRRELF